MAKAPEIIRHDDGRSVEHMIDCREFAPEYAPFVRVGQRRIYPEVEDKAADEAQGLTPHQDVFEEHSGE